MSNHFTLKPVVTSSDGTSSENSTMQQTSVDQAKRNTLKVLSGTSLVACIPSIALSTTGSPHRFIGENSETTTSLKQAGISSSELSISLSLDPEPVVTFSNHTDRVIIVSHVYPGLVHTGYRVFDINSLFDTCSYAVDANKSRSIAIEPTQALHEQSNPIREKYRNQRLRVAALTATDQTGLLANSTRSFYSLS